MQPKKNPNSDLRNYSRLLLAFGLCIVLFVSWQAIEFKTYEAVYDYESLNVDDDDDEEIPITEQIKTPPPPPPQALRDKQSSTQVRPCLIIRSSFSAAKNGRKG